jgi:hypothetical protein
VFRLEQETPGAGGRRWWRLPFSVAWYWPVSLLTLAVITGVLIALPPAEATSSHSTLGTSAKAAAAKAKPLPTLNVVVVGDFFSYGYAGSTRRALRTSVPPTLAALNQVQLANPDVHLHVLFIPVAEATWNRLYKGSGKGKTARPPLINAVKGARLVIAGVGADLPSFARTLRTALFGAHVPGRTEQALRGVFRKGSCQQEDTAHLDDIAASEAEGGAVVTLGYPLDQRVRVASHREWWSPLLWGTVSQKHARRTNDIVSVLDTANGAATKAAGTQYQDVHMLYADTAAMPGEASVRGAQATALMETLAGNTLLPYISQAVNDELTVLGVQGAADVSPITPGSRWVLSVQLPTVAPPARGARSGPGQRPVNYGVGRGNDRAPVRIPVPMIPAPPAPLPKPIAPLIIPKAVGGGGGGAGLAGAGAAAGAGAGAGAGGGGGSGGGTTGSGTGGGGGTTSSGPGTSASGGGSGSGSGAGPSSGGGSSSGGGASSGSGSGSGGGSGGSGS